MRKIAMLALLSLAAGCSNLVAEKRAAAPSPEHPMVLIQGVDGTLMTGELLNGSVTVDSGQGELTLLTDHLHSLTLAPDADKLDSSSMKLSGKIKDTRFMLRNEHGVFTLSKDRLRKIDFVNNPAPTATASGSAAGVSTVRSAGAAPGGR